MIPMLRRQWPLMALWLFACIVLVWISRDVILSRAGWDPDDQLRLVQLRDFLNVQGWFDTTQYRLNPPEGAPMHWSRLVELPLAAIVLMLTPLFGSAAAEMAAGTLVPLLYLGGTAFLLAQVGGRIGGRPVAIAACMLALIAPAMLIQLRPMRIDHHGAQIFCATLGFASLFWPQVRRAGLVLGAALAVWVHISLEGAPMTLAFFLLLGWRWMADAAQGERLFWTLAAFAGGSLLLFFGTQAEGLWAPQYCDTLSPAHIVPILLASMILIAATLWSPRSGAMRCACLLLAGGSTLAVLGWQNPQCFHGAFADLDPLVRSYWYANVREGLPVWEQRWQPAITLMLPLLVGLVALFAAWRIVPAAKRGELAIAGFFLIYGSLLSILVFRTVSVATAFTVIPLAVCLVAAIRCYRVERRLFVRLALVPVAIFLIAPGMIGGALVAEQENGKAGKADGHSRANSACAAVESVAALHVLPRGAIAAPFNLGPAILMATQHSVLASSHHRNRIGMRDQINLFRLPAAEAKQIIDRHGIDYIVSCPDEVEMLQYAKRAPGGLWAQIDAGAYPSWLTYSGTLGKGIRVWKVQR